MSTSSIQLKILFLSIGFIAAAALLTSATASSAQTELKAYESDNGYINAKTLTCDQLSNTFQEDANFLAAWYSGWYNGHAKKHSFNLAKTQAALHDVIVYCKSNPTVLVNTAVQTVVLGK